MNKLLFLVGAATLVACTNDQEHDNRTMNEPAGAAIGTNSMSMPARDMNQQPYPGASGLNQQRGTGDASSSSLQGVSGSSTRSGSASQNP